jgi:glycerophosphoryl diester phosphodiesterase
VKKIIIVLTLLAVGGVCINLCSGTEPVSRVVPSPEKVKVSAHRGANEFAPENTLAAFRKAVELGVDLIEIDLRKTKDNVNIIMHDSTLKRTTGLDGNVSDWNYTDLKEVSAGKRYSGAFASEKIPTLEKTCKEVAEANKNYKKNASFYVDCKDPELASMIQVLKKYSFFETSVFYGNDDRLKAICEIAPDAKLMPAYGSGDNLQERIENLKPYAFDVSWMLLNRELVDNLHSQGINVYSDAPVIASMEALLRVVEMGIDLIQTDRILHVQKAIKRATGEK